MTMIIHPRAAKFLLLIVLTFFGFFLIAQDTKSIPGDVRHKVEPLETFYSLSKKYGISIDEIKTANPGVEYPKAGEYIIIPGKNKRKQDPEPEFIIYTVREAVSIYILSRMLRNSLDSIEKWNPGIPSFLPEGTEVKTRPAVPGKNSILHTVIDERSSLRDLAQLYDLSYRTLKDFNPQIRNRVWFGQKVSIPVLERGSENFESIEVKEKIPHETEEKTVEKEEMRECRKDPRHLARQYRAALLVPFSLENLNSINTRMQGTPSELMDMPSFRFIQFYQGFLMAADLLAERGLKLNLSVYDVDQDISKIHDVINRPEMKEMDLIVGPFYKDAFAVASNFARNKGIPIVNPLSAREDILTGNPSVLKVQPSIMAQVKVVTSIARYRFYDHNILVVRENKYQGAEYIQSLRNSLEETLFRQVPEVDYMTDSITGVRSYLSDIQPNLVIIYAESEVLPMEILPLLYDLNKEMDIKIMGLPEWRDFEHLENKYLINLEAYLLSSGYIDYHEPHVKQFIREFRSLYLSEPVAYAFDGYDIAWYFLSLMMDYGHDFTDCLHQDGYPLVHNRYQFRKVPGGGYVNIHWDVYHYQDYSLMLVPDFR